MAIFKDLIKIIIAGLCIGCLFMMPYGYYQFVRFVGMLGFALLAYFSYDQKRNAEAIIYVALALLFQPFIKVALGRTVWNVVDVVAAVGLVGSLFVKKNGVRIITSFLTVIFTLFTQITFSQTKIDYTTYQDKKAKYAVLIGEYLKEKGYNNVREYSPETIKNAADKLGLPNKVIINDLVIEEGLIGYDAIPKSGWWEAMSRGLQKPFVGVKKTIDDLTNSDVEVYLRSQDYDVGQGQQVPDDKGQMGIRLPSDRGNVWYDFLNVLGQIISWCIIIGIPFWVIKKIMALLRKKRINYEFYTIGTSR